MEGPRLALIVVLLFFIWFSPNKPVPPLHNETQENRLSIEKAQDFNALANSSYGDLLDHSIGLNLTGFRPQDGHRWESLDQAFDLSRSQREDSWTDFDHDASFYHAIDGEVRGEYYMIELVKTNLSRSINLTELDLGAEYFSTSWQRNVTDKTGAITLNLKDTELEFKDGVREIGASLAIAGHNTSASSLSDTRLRGLHFEHSGLVVLTTSSRKFNALPALPHLVTDSSLFANATRTMNASITKIWASSPEPEDSFVATPSCELVIWLAPYPLSGSQSYIDTIEHEISDPEGAPIPVPPLLAFSATVFSPDCGFLLSAPSLSGPKIEVFSSLLRRLIFAFILILGAQIALLKRQIRRSATPSTRSRISYQTIAIAAFGDGMSLFAMIGLIMVEDSVYILAGAGAFLCVMLMAVLELKFILDIWTVQVAEPAERERERERGRRRTTQSTNTTAEPATTANTDTTATSLPATTDTPNPPTSTTTNLSSAGLPLPVTAPTPQPPPPNDAPQTFSSLYSRFYLTLLAIFFVSIWSLAWPSFLRNLWTTSLLISYASLYLPQIYRNALRNSRKSLSWEFIIGNALTRLTPVLYFLLTQHNIFHTTSRPILALVLLVHISLQITILAIQELFGPRFATPHTWWPNVYDYHAILREEIDVESGGDGSGGLLGGELSGGSSGDTKDVDDSKGQRKRVFDCAICMNSVAVPVVRQGEERSWLDNGRYMITPCRHVFHTECLLGWMDLRLVCPVCRESLPPV